MRLLINTKLLKSTKIAELKRFALPSLTFSCKELIN